MKTQFQSFARQSGKRARTKARRLAAMLRVYQRDPVGNYSLRSESVHLARSVSYYLRQAELVGRIILNIEGDTRPAFLPGTTPGNESARANGNTR
jgi:plasmid stabilization system protein ParE